MCARPGQTPMWSKEISRLTHLSCLVSHSRHLSFRFPCTTVGDGGCGLVFGCARFFLLFFFKSELNVAAPHFDDKIPIRKYDLYAVTDLGRQQKRYGVICNMFFLSCCVCLVCVPCETAMPRHVVVD